MNPPTELTKPNLREKAHLFSKITSLYPIPIFKLGSEKEEWEEQDIYKPATNANSEKIHENFETKWKQHSPSLIRTIAASFWKDLLVITLLQVFGEMICRFSMPLFFVRLLRYFKNNQTDVTQEDALQYASIMLLLNLGFVITTNQCQYRMQYLGFKLKTALYAMIYSKSLRLKKSSLNSYSSGKIVNLLTNDVKRFTTVTMCVTYLWVAPMHAIEVTAYLYYLFGIVGIIATASYFFLIIFQILNHKLSKKYRQKVSVKTDERIRYINEIVSGIQVIKLYAWEKPFAKLIDNLRKQEMKLLRKTNFIRGAVGILWFFNREWTMFISVLAMILIKMEVYPENVFMLAIYLTSLSVTTAFLFCLAIIETTETLVSVKRIQKFLLSEEKEPTYKEANSNNDDLLKQMNGKNSYYNDYNDGSILEHKKNNTKIFYNVKKIDENKKYEDTQKELEKLLSLEEKLNVTISPKRKNNSDKSNNVINKLPHHDDNIAVMLENVSCKFTFEDNHNVLSNLFLSIPKNQLVAVIGPVGSGKSTFFQLILRELEIVKGTMQINGSCSYACQDSWLFNGTVKQNILFGQPFDPDKYDRVIEACALEDDLKSFAFGDMTFVGDRGVSLSGGQKARVNLARAVYRDADIYLLDDPLSAVDPHVGKYLFTHCIKNYLSNKTVILATHQMQHLHEVNYLIALEDGAIQSHGTYNEVFGVIEENIRAQERRNSSIKPTEEVPEKAEKPVLDYQSKKDDLAEKPTNNTSSIRLLIKFYECAGSKWIVVPVLLYFFLAQFSISSGVYWLAIWVNDEEIRNENIHIHSSNITNAAPRDPIFSQTFEIYVAGILVVLTLITCAARIACHFYYSSISSEKLHDLMLKNLMSAKMQFFDKNPIGRILNRFSEDLGIVDENIPALIAFVLQPLLFISGGVLAVVAAVNPFVLLLVVIIAFAIYSIHKRFIITSVKIKQMEAVSRSPIISYLNSSVDGLVTVRALESEKILMNNFNGYLDLNLGVGCMMTDVTSSYTLVLLLSMFSFVMFVTYASILLKDILKNNSSEVGMAISMLCQVALGLQNMMMRVTELKNFLVSFDRTLEYTQIPCESTPNECEVNKSWPEAGRIEFKQVYLKYDEKDSYVLKNLNFTIESKCKIGIVGRTGAGKSSLIASLFRLADLEGNVFIDSVSTNTINLEKLRKNISIIPQNPVIFSGTLRTNLDPFNEHSDEALWNALEAVKMKNLFSDGLASLISSQGDSLSLGQKQLICLARAILRQNKILVLDEATANVDFLTDSLIQKTIRRIFNDCTVITIAHRLNTIMDSDKILVMHDGQMVEFDHPFVLYEKQGYFYSMVQKIDRGMRTKLVDIARNSYNEKLNRQDLSRIDENTAEINS